MIREQARDLGIFDWSRRFINNELNAIKDEDESIGEEEKIKNNSEKYSVLPENFDEKLEKEISENKWIEIQEFIVNIPPIAKKEDLFDFKDFLQKQEIWEIKIILDLRGQKKDTNISVKNLENLKNWIWEKWW